MTRLYNSSYMGITSTLMIKDRKMCGNFIHTKCVASVSRFYLRIGKDLIQGNKQEFNSICFTKLLMSQ